MFIIARRRGQRIEIGDDIAITVTEISRNLVKLGIEAPRAYLIARAELKESVALANREAALCSVAVADETVSSQGPEPKAEVTVGTPGAFMLASVKALASVDVSRVTEESAPSK